MSSATDSSNRSPREIFNAGRAALRDTPKHLTDAAAGVNSGLASDRNNAMMRLMSQQAEAHQALEDVVTAGEQLLFTNTDQEQEIQAVRAERQALANEAQVRDLQSQNKEQAATLDARADCDTITYSAKQRSDKEELIDNREPITPEVAAAIRNLINAKDSLFKRASYRTIYGFAKLDRALYHNRKASYDTALKQKKIGINAKYTHALSLGLKNKWITQTQFNACDPANSNNNRGICAQYANFEVLKMLLDDGFVQKAEAKAAAIAALNTPADAQAFPVARIVD